MVRPRKRRRVCIEPSATFFKPRGIPLSAVEKVTLAVEELEALRLAELQNMEQEKAAATMNVSQPTLHRILTAARRKVADALVNGKAIKIEGGDYMIAEGEPLFRCYECLNEWQEPYGTGRPGKCPRCGSVNIHRSPRDRGYARSGDLRRRHRHGHH